MSEMLKVNTTLTSLDLNSEEEGGKNRENMRRRMNDRQ